MPSESLHIHKPFQCFKYAGIGMKSMKDKGELGMFYNHINFQNRCRGFLFVFGEDVSSTIKELILQMMLLQVISL